MILVEINVVENKSIIIYWIFLLYFAMTKIFLSKLRK